MKQQLVRHPASPPSPVRKIEAEAARLIDGRVALVFIASGDIAALRVPEKAEPERRDGLWRHSCFEAFVASGSEAYFELNLSPSGEWAAYRFDGYRSGMGQADVPAPKISATSDARHLGLAVIVELGRLPELVPWESWAIGLSAVMEAADGTVSHWALKHPAGAADFHHRDCFAGQLAPAESL